MTKSGLIRLMLALLTTTTTFTTSNGLDSFDDWSTFNATVGDDPVSRLHNGGVLIQWSQAGLDYVAKLLTKASVRLLDGLELPGTKDEENGFEAKNIRVIEFATPRVEFKIIRDRGVGLKVLLPKMEISGDYDFDSGWVASAGTVRASVDGLLIQAMMSVERGPIGHPTFDIPYCNVNMASFRIAFSDTSSWGGSLLNNLRATIESMVTTQMSGIMCSSAQNATKLFEVLFIDPWSGPWLFDPDVVCPNMAASTATGPPTIVLPKTGSAIADRLLERVYGFTVDAKLNEQPAFYNDRVMLALKGDFYYNNVPAPLEIRPQLFPVVRQMVAFAVTEYVPDTFLYHVFIRHLAAVDEKVDMSQLPAGIRTPLRIVCINCALKILAEPNEPPKITMTRQGVKIHGAGLVKVLAQGFFHKFTVASGTAEIEASLTFRVTNNVIYGNLNLDSVRVTVSSSGVAGLVAATLSNMLEELIRNKVWPRLHDPVHQAIGVKGIPLPEVCGLSFNNTAISFMDGAVMVSTDLVYDMDGFITRLLASWARKTTTARSTTTTTTEDW